MLSKRTQTTTGTNNGKGLTRLDTRLLQTLVDGDTGAQNGSDGVQGNILGEDGDVSGLGDTELLEGSVDSVARERCIGAKRFVGGTAEFTREAGAIQPLDTSVITDVNVVDKLTLGDNDTGTFVATDKGHLDREGPVALAGVQICVADTSVLDVDEDLIGAGCWDGDLLVDNGAAGLLDDLSPLKLWKRHICDWSESAGRACQI